MSESGQAVFLSYASQDAEAAKRICEALRAAGVEVWFDQSELRGGDAWDQKIRRQIKECALFMPVISANTNARPEGYFRLEWKLAVDRSHLLADDHPFLFPIAIGDVTDATARVPDKFREVQWTRLRLDETPGELAARVVRLLAGGGAMEPERPRPGHRGEGAVASGKAYPGRWQWWMIFPVLGTIMGLLFAVVPLWRKMHRAPAKPPAGAPAAAALAATVPAPSRDWPRDPELKRAIQLIEGLESIPDDFVLAEEIARRAVERSPTDVEAATVMARVQGQYLLRGFDRSDVRSALAQRYAERAVQMAPDEPEALYALGSYLRNVGADLPRAERVLRRAMELAPANPRPGRILSNVMFESGRRAEAFALAEENVRRFSHDALTHYELSRLYRNAGRFADFERELDATLALAPLPNAMVWKARAQFALRNDLAGMRAWLDRVPERVRGVERTVFTRFLHAALSGQPEQGLEALRGFPQKWFEDFEYIGPTALLAGELLALQGRRELARRQYEAALGETRRLKALDPASPGVVTSEFWSLLGVGRPEEARAAYRFFLESIDRPYRQGLLNNWWFTIVPASLLVGERETALTLLRESVTQVPPSREAFRQRFRFDPRMAPFRDDPGIAAILAEPAPVTAVAPLSEAGKLAARAVLLYSKLTYTRDDLATAEELARKATDLEPDSAAAWGARAGVHATWLARNWDPSEKRRLDAQTAASRALGLDGGEPEALLALGRLLTRQGPAVQAQAEAALRRAVAARPDDNRIARALGMFLGVNGRVEEERAILAAALKRDPRDSLVHYDLAMSYANYGTGGATPANVTTAVELLDAGIAAQPLGSLLLLKAALVAGWRGDLPAMRLELDRMEKLPLSERTEDRAVFLAMWGALLERAPGRVVAAGALSAKSYFDDAVLPRRPKDWGLALAHRIEGKENLARLDWQRAESGLRQRVRDNPDVPFYVVELAATLAWLGRMDEAARTLAPVEAAWREELSPPRARALAQFHAAAGDAKQAAPYLQRALNSTVFMTTHAVRLDPWWDKLRGQPEFEALLTTSAK